MKKRINLKYVSVMMMLISIPAIVSASINVCYQAILDKYCYTALHIAVLQDHRIAIEQLLNSGADINACNKYGDAPLHYAARKGSTSVVKLLLKAGATINIQDEYGYTPLHEAVGSGHNAVVEMLLRADAHKSIKNKYGEAPLHLAARKGNSRAIELLLEAKADVNIQNEKGETPLYKAAFAGHAQATQLLVEARANAEYEDEFGITPLWHVLNISFEKPEAASIAHILLLMGNASLKKINQFSSQSQSLLREWGFEPDTFDIDLKKSKELAQERCKGLRRLLENYALPEVIATLIFEYYKDVDIVKLLFAEARMLTHVVTHKGE